MSVLENVKLPERYFLMGILYTMKNALMKALLKEARENRALVNNTDVDMMVVVNNITRVQLLSLLPNTSKCFKVDDNSCSYIRKS